MCEKLRTDLECDVSRGDIQCRWILPNSEGHLCCAYKEGHEGEHHTCYVIDGRTKGWIQLVAPLLAEAQRDPAIASADGIIEKCAATASKWSILAGIAIRELKGTLSLAAIANNTEPEDRKIGAPLRYVGNDTWEDICGCQWIPAESAANDTELEGKLAELRDELQEKSNHWQETEGDGGRGYLGYEDAAQKIHDILNPAAFAGQEKKHE